MKYPNDLTICIHSTSGHPPFNMPTPSKPQTFENSTHLRIFLILCKVFGTRPVIKVQDFRLGKRLLISFAHILWSCFILGLIVFSMNELNVQYMIGIAPILRILNLSEYTLNLMNCFIIMVGSNYQRQWQDIYFRHLKSIDKRLQFSMAEANAKLNQFLHVVFMVSLAFIVPVMTIMFNFYVGNLRALAITYIAYIVTNLIIALALIQFFVLLFMVEMRYKHLVSALGGLSWSETFSHFPANAGIYRNTFVLEMRAIGRKNNSHLNQHLSSIKRRIDVLRTCYVDLNILERNISESFGFFIVSLVISTFFVETSKLYVFYTLTRENVDFLTLAYSAFWLILHLVIIFSLLYFSSRVGQQVSRELVKLWIY